MSIVIGLDIGTTTVTAVAVEAGGSARAVVNLHNDADAVTPGLIVGKPVLNVDRIVAIATQALASLGRQLGEDGQRVVGLALTGQQHGCLLIDSRRRPKTRFVGWQHRGGDEPMPGVGRSYVEEAVARSGEALAQRTGCRLASGFMATTLFRWRERGTLKEDRTACFISDFIAARLTRAELVTDPTMAASAGVFSLKTLDWDRDAIAALGLARTVLPDVRPAGSLLGRIRMSRLFNLPPDVPVFVGIGDHQAGFLGSVADPANSLFVNVGTGGQVAAYIDAFQFDPALETRPFPDGGFELVSAGLTGGKAYATLEAFFRRAGADLLGDEPTSLFSRLNALAEQVPPGAGGLRCLPFFAGTRAEPGRTATWSGMTECNFTPGHMARAVLEGMARALREGADQIEKNLPAPREVVVGAGNGIRENPLFASILAREFGRPLLVPHHREEAAYGAAIVAAVGAGLLPNFSAAARWIRYDKV